MASPYLPEEEKEEEEVVESSSSDDDEEQLANHYSSTDEILLVGEGDFSFSLSLANAFGSAYNITATSLDPHGLCSSQLLVISIRWYPETIIVCLFVCFLDVVVAKYTKARSNLERLDKMGATIIHGVDATKMKLHSDLKMRRFDRVIFNFPHAGFKGKENEIHLINLHRQLVHGFFHSASRMIRRNGEIHVTHKTEEPYNKWKLEELASRNSLMLMECADFSIADYPGYANKRGDGVNCDHSFRLGDCCTYKFVFGDVPGRKKFSNKEDTLAKQRYHPQADDWMFGMMPRPLPTYSASTMGMCYPPRRVAPWIFSRNMTQAGVATDLVISSRFYSPPRTGIVRPPPTTLFEDRLPRLARTFCPGFTHAGGGRLDTSLYEAYINARPCRNLGCYTRWYPEELYI